MQRLNIDQQFLIVENLEVARRQAKRWSRKFDRIEFEDYYQAACLGMCKAVSAWDGEKWPDVKTFLGTAAKFEIKKLLRNYGRRHREKAVEIPEREIDGGFEQGEIREDVQWALGNLDAQSRFVIDQLMDEITAEQTGRAMQVSRTTITNWRGGSYEMLRKFLSSYA